MYLITIRINFGTNIQIIMSWCLITLIANVRFWFKKKKKILEALFY